MHGYTVSNTLLVFNQLTDFLETWYERYGTVG
jgi:hypothetical protein